MKREKPTGCKNWMFIINFYLNMFRASLYPSSGEQSTPLLHLVYFSGSAGYTICSYGFFVLLKMGIMMSEIC
jgi:hypothetical protein